MMGAQGHAQMSQDLFANAVPEDSPADSTPIKEPLVLWATEFRKSILEKASGNIFMFSLGI